MDHTLGKSIGHFISNQILRDDYVIIDDSANHSDKSENVFAKWDLPIQAKITRLQSLCLDNKYLTAAEISARSQRLNQCYQKTKTIPSPLEIAQTFLPDSVVSTNTQQFGRQQDHAQLLKRVSAATGGRWSVNGADSRQDRKDNCWVVAYKGQRKSESFRFTQKGDCLDPSFLSWLIVSAENRTGYRISCHSDDNYLSIVCLPNSIHSLLIENDAALFAA